MAVTNSLFNLIFNRYNRNICKISVDGQLELGSNTNIRCNIIEKQIVWLRLFKQLQNT